jgi:hypothetical protein
LNILDANLDDSVTNNLKLKTNFKDEDDEEFEPNSEEEKVDGNEF